MTLPLIAILLILAFAFWFVLRARAKWAREGAKQIVSPLSNKEPAEAGRELRLMMLRRMPPQDLGVAPSDEFHRVYGVLMEQICLLSRGTGELMLNSLGWDRP